MARSPFLDLSRGYEEYAAERKRKRSGQIRNTLALRRKLEREVGPVRIALASQSEEALTTLIGWKSAQYVRSGLVDAFRYRWMVRLLHRLLETKEAELSGLLSTLHAGDHLVAAHMGLRSGPVCHYWLPAYDVSFRKYSPGLVLLIEMTRAASSLGVGRIDLGRGDEPYKRRLASGNLPIAEASVSTGGLMSRAPIVARRLDAWIHNSSFSRLIAGPIEKIKRLHKRLSYL